MKHGLRGLSALAASVAVGALLASPAVAQNAIHAAAGAKHSTPGLASGKLADQSGHKRGEAGTRCREDERGFGTDIVAYGTFANTEFRLVTNGKGEAFLNDSRSPGVWTDIDVVPNAPKCVIDADVSATDSGAARPNKLFLNVETDKGAIYEAVCDITATPFSASNLVVSCGSGFTELPGTPVR
ncbi:hypothetical protein [Streptomyces sp. Ag109_O5-10]|uniref:hypothetical protein n=1 Tax=Streptomyces sp. Ag109_O5-10 TaxID=1855349 RepID=UPI00089B1203|nr:hypothetical protein [Streptomyces sp. Ag109_O5-10]SEE37846.1 hypothetical protein SAMN05216533_2124 [Streptomyces sp. Ag109_O5-10]